MLQEWRSDHSEPDERFFLHIQWQLLYHVPPESPGKKQAYSNSALVPPPVPVSVQLATTWAEGDV